MNNELNKLIKEIKGLQEKVRASKELIAIATSEMKIAEEKTNVTSKTIIELMDKNNETVAYTEDGIAKISNTVFVEIVDEALIPDRYIIPIMNRKINKAAIRESLISGQEIEGAVLSKRKTLKIS